MFLRNCALAESPFQMSHLLENERIVRQSPQSFFVRLERTLEIAQNTVAINALCEPCFAQLGPEGHRSICGLFHSGARICLRFYTVEIKIAARDGKTRPRHRELRIMANGLGIQVCNFLHFVESLGIIDSDRDRKSVV